ncbi:predicted protein, partial [Nematostella vectensis]
VSLPHKHIVKTVHFSSDGIRLLTGSNEKILRIFDLQNLDSEPQVLTGHTGSIKTALWNKENNMVYSGGDDKMIRLWDTRTLENTRNIQLPHNLTNMDMSRDGNVLVITHGTTVVFYETESMDVIKSFEMPTLVYGASLHPDKSCFVAGGEDLKIYKFDYDTGKELESYKGHFGPVHCVRYSPDGELYASGSEDGTLRLWQHTVGKTYGLWRAV